MGIENPVHLIFIGAVALVVLGPKRLPELAKALGNGIREFRESISDGEHEPREAPAAAAPVAQAAPAPVQPEPVVAEAPAPGATDEQSPAAG
jgi:sec-independent protein translocase protein TatA